MGAVGRARVSACRTGRRQRRRPREYRVEVRERGRRRRDEGTLTNINTMPAPGATGRTRPVAGSARPREGTGRVRPVAPGAFEAFSTIAGGEHAYSTIDGE